MKDFTEEAAEYLRREVPKINDAVYAALGRMIGGVDEQLTLVEVEFMLTTAMEMDYADAMMYGTFLGDGIRNRGKSEEYNMFDYFTDDALELFKQEVGKLNLEEFRTLHQDLHMRNRWKNTSEFTKDDVESFIYMAKYPDEVEALAFGGLNASSGGR